MTQTNTTTVNDNSKWIQPKRKIVGHISILLACIESSKNAKNRRPSVIAIEEINQKRLSDILKNHAPSGSGFDNGTKLADESTPEKLIFITAFHHMNENGFYCGWTEHKVIVTPSFYNNHDIRVTGRNKNNIKEYLTDVFSGFLDTEI